ncbi:MAG: replication restart DNA helicase PriA [Rhizonema sp. PD37]|nr:replication restart DNA helicase PriA [Rhizonema sp. PD37]
MNTVQKIRCPNCGSHGERHYNSHNYVTRTQCPICDYLMVSCRRTGRVIEAYAPGINANR